MKNIFTYLTVVAMMLFVSCSSDSIIAEDSEVILEEGTMATKPSLECGDDTRSLLYLQDGKMKFEWQTTDSIAVYPMYVEGTDQEFESIGQSMRQVLFYRNNTTGDNGIAKAEFSINEEKYILNIANTKDFVAWSPYRYDRGIPEMGYTEMPVTYENQIQSANVELGHYVTSDEAEMALYLESEKAASAHLGDFDYLYAQAEQGNTGYTCFDFSHLQATVRFYMLIPEPEKPQVFDSLIVYHKFDSDGVGVNFVSKGKFNLDDMSFSVDKKVSKLKLKLGTDREGLNLIDKTEGSDTEGKYLPKYKRNGKYYLIAYMQVYPVDMTDEHILMPTLYLCGHTGTEGGGDLKKNFYKARLAKKNIEAGKWYQWSTTLDEDEPIEFEVVQVQEWLDDDTYYNTVDKTDGRGTENW